MCPIRTGLGPFELACPFYPLCVMLPVTRQTRTDVMHGVVCLVTSIPSVTRRIEVRCTPVGIWHGWPVRALTKPLASGQDKSDMPCTYCIAWFAGIVVDMLTVLPLHVVLSTLMGLAYCLCST